jgi:3-hydroxybutyryl-CoA dehydratase
MEQGKTIEEIKRGEKAALTRKITEEDIGNFARATGDYNPLHIDETYAQKTIFHGRIAHGMLVASLFSNLIATKLPGPGTVYLSQTLHFKRPVRIGDILTAEIEVIEINTVKKRVTLSTLARNQDETIVLEGEAVVLPRS